MFSNILDKRLHFFVLLISVVVFSCKDDSIIEDICVNNEQESVDVTVTDDGYLSFPTVTSLEAFFAKIQNGESPIIPLSRGGNSFKSIAMLNRQLQLNREHSKSRGIDDTNATDLDELEEMTADEYNIMKAEKLLFDNILEHVMDTTLRICVEGVLYKISEHGTFSVVRENASIMDSIIIDFDPLIRESIGPGETIALDNEVKFTNTFMDVKLQDDDFLEYYPANPTDESLESSYATESSSAHNGFHNEYCVQSYKWKNTNVLLFFLDWLRGKDVSKTNNFNKNLRVKVNIFDVNYAFYKSAGIKVSMQKKKKFCFIPYWVGVEAEKIAIGFNEMKGELKYNNPNEMSIIQPTPNARWIKLTGKLNGIAGNFIYGTFHKLKFIQDWTEDIFAWMPELRIGDKNYTDLFINKIYNTPPEYIYKFSKSLVNKQIYTPILKRIQPKDPMVAYLIWGTSTYKFDKERPYITGVKEYTSIKSKSVIFDRSFGVAFYGVVPVPYTPSDFNIENIDAFGAAYYNGQWLGVRFFTE